jgi:hypothetical protein
MSDKTRDELAAEHRQTPGHGEPNPDCPACQKALAEQHIRRNAESSEAAYNNKDMSPPTADAVLAARSANELRYPAADPTSAQRALLRADFDFLARYEARRR